MHGHDLDGRNRGPDDDTERRAVAQAFSHTQKNQEGSPSQTNGLE
jgi:hypothetical protein